MKPKLIAIVGPTAVGKTALSIMLAKEIGGGAVSADSRQVYRGLDIGTGKVTREEMQAVPHHLLDVADPQEIFTAAEYVRLGRTALEEVTARKQVPIVVGGTGFYIDALLGRISLANVPPNPVLRADLSRMNLEELRSKLEELDVERYETIDIQNPVRLIRAIEVAIALGKNPLPNTELLYDVLWIGLTIPLPEVREKIKARLSVRLENGMLDEARKLHTKGLSYERMDELGLEYRFMARHLMGEISHEEMVANLEKEIFNYAKRQMTWFKKNKEIHWFAPTETEKAIILAKDFLK